MIASTGLRSSSSISAPFSSLGMPGIIPSRLPSGPIFFSCCICSRKSSRVNSPSISLLGGLLGLVLLEGLLGLLDEREHVAHAEDPPGHAVGVELLEGVELLPRRGEGDRLADDLLDADSAAPPRASPSSLERMTPSIASVSLNASATPTASWPVIASTTRNV